MFATRIARALLLSSSCVLGALAGTVTTGGAGAGNPTSMLALQGLQATFHGANSLGDYELMRSIWAEDAVFFGPTGPIVGRDAIADFFAAGAQWGQAASLAPSYKTWFDIDGNHAEGQFECVIINTGGGDPLETTLSTVPFGGQNPNVTIVQHSTASVTAVRRHGTWLLHTFRGSAGPMQ